MIHMKAIRDSEIREEDLISPRTENRRLNLEEIKIEDESKNLLKCCSNHSFIDKRLILEVSKLLISFSTLSFSFVMILYDDDDNDNLYFSLISLITGYYLDKQTK
jgi:hypothetical protein